jgi:hypothetical protein
VGSDLTNYAITYADGTLTVNPAALTITANNQIKAAGQTLVFAGTEFSCSGLVNGDTVSSVTLTCAGAAAAATVSGSPYPITPSAAVGTGLGNYTISYVNGLLTIIGSGLVPPEIQSAQAANGLFNFVWSATPGRAYQIQYATDLNQNIWANLGVPLTAISSTASASDSLTNTPMFYRVLLLP